MNDQIRKLRQEIDAIDTEIQALFLRRMSLVKEIAAYKMANDIPVYDAVREAEIIEKRLASIVDSPYAEYYRIVLDTLMRVSKEYQKTLVMQDAI
jgi:chorismate mutase/prephenate dehydratase